MQSLGAHPITHIGVTWAPTVTCTVPGLKIPTPNADALTGVAFTFSDIATPFGLNYMNQCLVALMRGDTRGLELEKPPQGSMIRIDKRAAAGAMAFEHATERHPTDPAILHAEAMR
jgi:hypothetical protein